MSGWDNLSGLLAVTGQSDLLSAGLYEAKTPWGKWNKVASLPVGDISAIIPKGHGDDHFYFTGASFITDGSTAGYNLNIGKMQLKLE